MLKHANAQRKLEIMTPLRRAAIAKEMSVKPAVDTDKLWLHIHLPQLPIDILTRGSEQRRACVLCEGQGTRRKIALHNSEAARLGVRVGMPLSAAHILGDITVLETNADLEKKVLKQICMWALQFSPVISTVSNDGLLIEIKGSLKLFNGLHRLLSEVRKGLKELGYKAFIAVAPTPLGATALARTEQHKSAVKIVTDNDALIGVLSKLPLHVLRLSAEHQSLLANVGVRSIGDCLRLPRGGLGRRSSPQLLEIFDRLCGRHPDPRICFEVPKLFQSHIDLPWETHKAQTLTLAGERLLQELTGYLRGMSGLTQRLRWSLQHTDKTLTHFQLELAKPSRDPAYFAILLREKIARLEINKDIRDIALYVDEIVQEDIVAHADLFDTQVGADGRRHEDWAGFIDRLRTRLGDNAVKRLKAISDHRPECAWRWQRPLATEKPLKAGPSVSRTRNKPASVIGAIPNSGIDVRGSNSKMPARPVWLMRRPLKIENHNGSLDINGPLKLLAERERIETGWWDGKPIGRDYFVAANPTGAKLWIYRELSGDRDWFLHGIFD